MILGDVLTGKVMKSSQITLEFFNGGGGPEENFTTVEGV